MNKKWIALLLVSMLALTTLTACGTTTTTAGSASAGTTAKTKLTGPVIVDGSGTVYPLMAHIAEEYMVNEQSGVSVQVGRAGSSAGFKKFIPGETDLSDASRKIKDEEVEALKAEGLEMGTNVLEIKLAYDGLTLVINKDNTWATDLTEEEVVRMYTAGSYKADDKVLWSDVRPGWPAEEIKFFGPNENHGTYEFFYEVILDEQTMVSTVNLQQEYSTLVDLVTKDKNAIAFFGYGYYASNFDKLKAVKVDFGSGPVEPSLDTIGEELPYAGFTRLSGTYNMVRMIVEDYKAQMNIRVVDSQTLSTGLGAMVLVAAQALEAGEDPDSAVQKAKNARSSQLGMFVIRTLEYLRKGGRIGLVEGVVGNLLQIKPIIFINDDGVYQTLAKARGYKAAVETMMQEAVQRFGKAKINLSVVHGQALEDAQALMDKLKQTLNIAQSMSRPVSPGLAVHTGPGLLGIVANLAE